MRFITNVIINMAVFLACSMLFPVGFQLADMLTALVAAILLAILNIILKPILFILSLPILVVTLGLFTIVINTILLEITAHLLNGFAFTNFGWAMLVAIILAGVNFVFNDRSKLKIERY